MRDFFDGKPETFKIFKTLERQIAAAGASSISVASQISFSAQRKFAWVWLYSVTKKNPSGVLHLMLAINHRIDDPHVRSITQTAKNRWNHQVVVRALGDAKSRWLQGLIEQAYIFGSR